MISCASTDGSVVSTQWTRTSPDSMRLEQRLQPVDVERLVQRVVDRLAHEQVVGDLDRAGGVVLAGGGLGNTAAIRSSDSMRWMGGGLRLPPGTAGPSATG